VLKEGITYQKFGKVIEFEPRWDICYHKRGLVRLVAEKAFNRIEDATQFTESLRFDFRDIGKSDDVPKDPR